MKSIRPITILQAAIVAALLFLPSQFVGCADISKLKPVPVAAGHDAIVVNSERIQETSLFAYQQLIEWEYNSRASLPVTVSRAVDQVRATFPDQWKASRRALVDYKAKRGDSLETLDRVNAALSAAQTAMLSFRKDATQVVQLLTAMSRLAEAVQTLKPN